MLEQRYLGNVVATNRKMIAQVFHVFHWTKRELGRTIAALLEEEAIREVRVKGAKKPRLVSNCALDRAS